MDPSPEPKQHIYCALWKELPRTDKTMSHCLLWRHLPPFPISVAHMSLNIHPMLNRPKEDLGSSMPFAPLPMSSAFSTLPWSYSPALCSDPRKVLGLYGHWASGTNSPRAAQPHPNWGCLSSVTPQRGKIISACCLQVSCQLKQKLLAFIQGS